MLDDIAIKGGIILEKINIIDVLREGLELYRNNFSRLFRASLVYVTVLFISSVISFLSSIFKIGVISFIDFFVVFASIYIGIRLLISITILVRDIIKSDESQLVNAYAEAKQYFWRYIGNTFLIAIPAFIPVYYAMSLQRIQMPILYKLPQLAIIAIVVGIITSYLHFAPISVALEPNLENRVKYSFKLVKGKLIKVLSILILSSYVFTAPIYVFNYFAPIQFKSAYLVFILDIIVNIIYLFSTPFTACVGAILFYKLRDMNNTSEQ